MLTKYINIQLFIISFAIGLVFVYILGPETKTIYMYPTPSNYKKTQYKDNTDQCFTFKPTETHCPVNPFDIKTIPVQAS
jgi:hypothetical protein